MKLRIRVLAFVLSIIFCITLCTPSAFAFDSDGTLPSGYEHIDYDHITEFADGGKDYVYIINGVINHALVPPEGFDPVTASDDSLAQYCFPPRPTNRNSVEYIDWVSQMSKYSGTETPNLYVKNKLNESTHTSGKKYGQKSATIYSANWSGYIADLGANSTSWYSQVQGDYTHPTISATSGTCLNSYWVGLGGYNSGKLVQAGTATYGQTSHFAWYEYLSTAPAGQTVPMQVITGLTINAGDSIHLYIAFQKANDKFGYYVANNSTGMGSSGYVENLTSSLQFDGTTAEWVVERCMSSSGSLYNLGNYGACNFTNCKVTNNSSNTWLDASAQSNLYKVIMTSSGSSIGTTLSTPNTMSSNNSFSCTWNAYS